MQVETPENQTVGGGTPAMPYVAVLAERQGGMREKNFPDLRSCEKYLGRHHDSVTSYDAYQVTSDGTRTLWKSGVFTPRTLSEKQKDRKRLRRNRRRRRDLARAARSTAERPMIRW